MKQFNLKDIISNTVQDIKSQVDSKKVKIVFASNSNTFVEADEERITK